MNQVLHRSEPMAHHHWAAPSEWSPVQHSGPKSCARHEHLLFFPDINLCKPVRIYRVEVSLQFLNKEWLSMLNHYRLF